MPRNLFAQFAARALSFAPFSDVRRMKRRAESVQRRRLSYLLESAAETELGQEHGFRDLLAAPDPVEGYQQRVPLRRYDDFESSIERVRRGEANVLWPGKFRFFGMSGGTYSTGKVVPANSEMLSRTIRGGVAMTLNYIAETGNLAAVTGAIIPLTGRLFPSTDYPETILGNFSGLLTQFRLEEGAKKRKPLPEWFPDRTESLYLADWEKKLDRLADVTMERDVRYVALIPTWGIVFFRKLIERYNRRFHASAGCVRDIWPRLQLVVSGGMALAPYREILSKIVGPPSVDFLNTYGAMEAGLVAFQSSLARPEMLLNTEGGNFFEFIRYEDRDRKDAERFWIGNIEAGRNYVPVISNSNGLWAYVLGDVVRFTQSSPPMMEVVGRTAEILSLYREGLTGALARSALEAACRQVGAQVMQFHVTYSPAEVAGPRRHQWFVEFICEPEDISRLEQILDGQLAAMCSSYERVRAYHGLGAPRLLSIQMGGMNRALGRLGRQLDAQTKVPCMTEGREFADALADETSRLRGKPLSASESAVATGDVVSTR